MALQLGALRDAFLDAGASEEKAREAAEEVAAYENRLVSIQQKLAELRLQIDHQFAELRSGTELRFAELRSYVDLQIAGLRRAIRLFGSFIIALLVPILVKLFVHG